MYKSETKEMTYSTTKQSILYLEVNDDDTAICIIDRGGWPCSYIKMPENVYQNHVEATGWDGNYDDVDVSVHGGVTFGEYGTLYIRDEQDLVSDDRIPVGYWIGWDYAHAGDYCYHGQDIRYPFKFNSLIEKKYTTAELVEEAHEALEELRSNDFRIYTLED